MAESGDGTCRASSFLVFKGLGSGDGVVGDTVVGGAVVGQGVDGAGVVGFGKKTISSGVM